MVLFGFVLGLKGRSKFTTKFLHSQLKRTYLRIAAEEYLLFGKNNGMAFLSSTQSIRKFIADRFSNRALGRFSKNKEDPLSVCLHFSTRPNEFHYFIIRHCSLFSTALDFQSSYYIHMSYSSLFRSKNLSCNTHKSTHT